jgi:uroporphyrinogen-III synthase
VTRAEPGAARTAARLATLGFDPVVAPLLAIQPLAPPRPDLEGVAALAFTSANGVAAFAELTGVPPLPVFTVGDATAEAARALGFADVRSAGGAVEDLARLLVRTGPTGGIILAPGAREPAGDLAALVGGDKRVRRLAVYDVVGTDRATSAAFDAVLIHSPRAARALAERRGPVAAGRLAATISPAAAAPLSGLGFREVRVAAAPTEAALLRTLGNPVPAV